MARSIVREIVTLAVDTLWPRCLRCGRRFLGRPPCATCGGL
jgi:hypothetical protein